MWTLDELVDRVGRALAAEYSGAPNGRVRDVPDRRAIRWYKTIGLIDRPLGMSGRTALYGPRHLLQLVAVKRRQAAGRSIAQIQAELTGADDEVLAEVARVPTELMVADGPRPDVPSVDRSRFWATPAHAVGLDVVVDVAQVGARLPDVPGDAPAPPAGGQVVPVGPAASAVSPAGAGATPGDGDSVLGGVRLGGGAILVLPGVPDSADLAAISAAAAPLLDVLAGRGLLEITDNRRPS